MAIPETASFGPLRRLSGAVRTPGDKSISHRSLLLGAMTAGESVIEGLSDGRDVHRTKTIVKQLGTSVIDRPDGSVAITGGPATLRGASSNLDCGNSGTTIRLLLGVVASIPGRHELSGDPSLSQRPMDRVAEPLRLMGAQIIGVGPTQTPPLVVTGRELHGIEYSLPVASAQVKSAILLAGLSATGTTTVREPSPTRSHTEEMLAQAGAAIEIHHDGSLTTITLEPSTLVAQRWIIPADPSNAAFFIVAGLLVAHGSITCEGVYAGPARTGFLDVLERMGASVDRQLVAATVLDITARPHSLTGTDVQAEEIPSLDEIPILVVAACAATGTTRFFDAGELRIKESDRFEACLDLAGALGARAWSDAETLCVEGLGGADAFNHLEFDARGDHRMALAASVAAVVGNGGVVHGFESIETNYPQFLADLERLT